MPYKKIFTPNGKYFKQIDWLLVQKLIDEGLSGIEIAQRVGVCAKSLYARVMKEHGWYLCHWQYKRRLLAIGSDYDPYPNIKNLE
jgi:hypothetical protein